MTTYTRHWIVEGAYLGKSFSKGRWIHERFCPPIGYHFFCTHCGRLWAQCPVDGQRHMVWALPCAEHQWQGPDALYGSEIAGSLVMEWEPEFLAEMPEKVLRREIAVHLRWGAISGMLPPAIASSCSSMLPYFST